MGQNNNGIISPAFPPVLTFVSLVCCVGHCGEGTDWVSDDRKSGTKVGSSAKVPPSCQRWCRPQSKLPKPTASQKARHFAGENSNQNVHVGYFQSRFQSATFYVLFCSKLFECFITQTIMVNPNLTKRQSFFGSFLSSSLFGWWLASLYEALEEEEYYRALRRPQFLALAMVDIVHRAAESLCYIDHCKCTYNWLFHIFPVLDNIKGNGNGEQGPKALLDPCFKESNKFQP